MKCVSIKVYTSPSLLAERFFFSAYSKLKCCLPQASLCRLISCALSYFRLLRMRPLNFVVGHFTLIANWLKSGRLEAEIVTVPEEENGFAFSLSGLTGLNPLAGSERGPHSSNEAEAAIFCVRAIMMAHDLLDGFSGFISIIKGDGADIVVENVGFDDAVQELAADESKFTIDSSSGSTGEIPCLRLIVGKGWVGVLQEGDGNWRYVSMKFELYGEWRHGEHTEPVVNPEVGDEVPDQHVDPSKFVSERVQNGSNDQQTQIAE